MKRNANRKSASLLARFALLAGVFILAGYVPAVVTRKIHLSMVLAVAASLLYGLRARHLLIGLVGGAVLGGLAGLAGWAGLLTTRSMPAEQANAFASVYATATAGFCGATAGLFAFIAQRRRKAKAAS